MQQFRNKEGYLAKIDEAETELITSVRLLNLNAREKNNQERLIEVESKSEQKESKKQKIALAQCYDTMTLEVDFYQNNNRFFEMMR